MNNFYNGWEILCTSDLNVNGTHYTAGVTYFIKDKFPAVEEGQINWYEIKANLGMEQINQNTLETYFRVEKDSMKATAISFGEIETKRLYIQDNKITNSPTDKEISIFEAIELIIYNNYDPTDTGLEYICIDTAKEVHPSWQISVDDVLEIYKPRDIEKYGWAVVVDEKTQKSDEDLLELLKRSKKDYVLEHRKGPVTIYHKTDNLSALINSGYKPSLERIDTGGGSFAIGLYALLVQPDKTFVRGTFDGHYFVCICVPTDDKDGTCNPDMQEIFIPWNTRDIVWG